MFDWKKIVDDFGAYDLVRHQFDKSKNRATMQYTGLMDDEGADIYEGDIVPFDEENLKCIIETDGVWFENDNLTMRYDDFKKFGKALKVVGNIYEKTPKPAG